MTWGNYCYAATFEGNGHTISNLYINRAITNDFSGSQVGLFGGVYNNALRNVVLVNPQISITRSGTTAPGNNPRYTNIGGLVGFMGGGATAITNSWVDGGSITFIQGAGTGSTASVGCLLGRAFTQGAGTAITVSDATCAVNVTAPLRHTNLDEHLGYSQPLDSAGNNRLLDNIREARDTNGVYAGGLAGYISGGSITASYATGNVTCVSGDDGYGGNMNCAGLVADFTNGTIDSSYATGDVVNEGYFPPVLYSYEFGNALQGIPDKTHCNRIYDLSFHSAGLVGVTRGDIIRSYSTGRVDAAYEGADCIRAADRNVNYGVYEPVSGLAVSNGGSVSSSYWDRQTSGIRWRGHGTPRSTAQLQSPTDYTGIYESWNVDLDSDSEMDDPWDFGNAREYPILKYGRDELRIARQRGEAPPPEEPEEYVAPPIVYNLNIRFNVKGLTLDEGESATYRVRMSQPPVGHPARIAITSNNPDVAVSPTELTFSSANFREWQTVKVSTLRDANDTDESATIAHRGPSLSYGSILVTVNDTWPGAATATVNGHTVTTRHTLDAPYGVTVTAPATLDANTHITIAGPPPGTPEGAPGYGLGQSAAARMLADIRVSGAPSAGLTICLPIPAALAAEAGDRPLTLLRYANAAWTPVVAASPTNGTDGADGAAQQDGANGADGAARQDSANGADGAARQDSANGADGAARQDSANGADGAARQDGANGADGVDSADGAAQQDGAADANGVVRQTAADGTPMLCAAGITEYGVFAVAYTLPALGAPSDLTATPGEALGSVTLTWTPGANAARHWLAGVKQSDRSQLAIWAAADSMASHTVSDLEPGATYIFTITAGRGEGDSRQWSAWPPWATATPPAPQPTPTPKPKPTFNPPPFPLSQ